MAAEWALANGCPEPEDKLEFCANVATYRAKFPLIKWAVDKKGRLCPLPFILFAL